MNYPTDIKKIILIDIDNTKNTKRPWKQTTPKMLQNFSPKSSRYITIAMYILPLASSTVFTGCIEYCVSGDRWIHILRGFPRDQSCVFLNQCHLHTYWWASGGCIKTAIFKGVISKTKRKAILITCIFHHNILIFPNRWNRFADALDVTFILHRSEHLRWCAACFFHMIYHSLENPRFC